MGQPNSRKDRKAKSAERARARAQARAEKRARRSRMSAVRKAGEFVRAIVSRVWFWVVTVGVLAGYVGLYLALQPQLSVTAGDAASSSNPFLVPFRVTNSGPLALRDVRVVGRAHSLEMGDWITGEDLTLFPRGWASGDLARQDSRTFHFVFAEDSGHPSPIGATFLSASLKEYPPKRADLFVLVEYRSAWSPWRSRACFRFVGERIAGWQWNQQTCPPDAIEGPLDRKPVPQR